MSASLSPQEILALKQKFHSALYQCLSNLAADVTARGNNADDRTEILTQELSSLYHSDAEWRGSHPINEHSGLNEIVKHVWAPLLKAMPDLERRDSLLLGGEYEGRVYIACVGHYTGTLQKPWLSLPAVADSQRIIRLRYGEVHEIRDGKIAQTTALWDTLDFIFQAGFTPLAPSTGDEILWLAPITGDGLVFREADPVVSAASLQQTLAMHKTLNEYNDLAVLSRESLIEMDQRKHWHPQMMWYGPAGIGTGRGLAGFVDWHQLPFRQAFPNRKAVGHYIRIGDGHYSATGGWPSVVGLHNGGDFLSLPPTGKEISMRVMDFYNHHEGLIRENWVPLDMLHVLLQMGVDVLARIRTRHPRT